MSPLAVGADRLVARVALSEGVQLRVPMPLEEREYRKDFDAAENAEFSTLLARADESHAMAFAPGNDSGNVGEPGRRAAQYQKVGEYVARLSHVLIALWDGRAATSVGGTASIVAYRLSGTHAIPADPAELLDVPPRGAVYRICTPRLGKARPDDVGRLIVQTRKKRLDASNDPFCPLYHRIERFNKDIVDLGPIAGAAYSIAGMRGIAKSLATSYQIRYLWALRVLFGSAMFAAILLALAHGERPYYPFVLSYAVLFTVGYVTYWFADSREWKGRAIEYRALEIGLSIQQLWDRVGCDESAANAYLRIQRSECDWIRQAVQSIHFLARKIPVDVTLGLDVTRDFIESQRVFFAKAVIRDTNKARKYNQIAKASVFIGALLTLALVGVALSSLYGHDVFVLRGWSTTKGLEAGNVCIRGIIICTIVAAGVHEYSRRRAFDAQSRRYAAMRPIFGRAIEIIELVQAEPSATSLRVARGVAEQIGKEALAENGEWLLMHRDLPLDPVHV